MSYLEENEFSSYNLSDEEYLEGSKLSILQRQVIQNQISIIAHEKNALEYDDNNRTRFIQQEAEKKGQLSALNHLLECSNIAQETAGTMSIDLSQEHEEGTERGIFDAF